jgi:hypothetical protein
MSANYNIHKNPTGLLSYVSLEASPQSLHLLVIVKVSNHDGENRNLSRGWLMGKTLMNGYINKACLRRTGRAPVFGYISLEQASAGGTQGR